MALNVDLTTAPVIPRDKVPQTAVAVFKEEAEVPRVLGESDAFIAYTLKNRRAIRVICRANNERAAFRRHEGIVHDLRFVNFHSNVAASASDKDFFVWVAVLETVWEGQADEKTAPTHRLTVKPYFRLVDPVVVQCFHFFINPSNNMPDLLLLYNKSAAVLQSSKLISEYTTEMLNAKLGEQSHELRQLPQEASPNSLCSTFSGGWLAFTAEATRVMACTLRNPATPAWSGCEGEEILQLCFVGSAAATESASSAAAGGAVTAAAGGAANSSSALLAICSAKKVYLWKLTGVAEPVLLRTFTFGNIVTMLSSRNALAVFNDAGLMARVVVQDEARMDSVAYELRAPVRPTSVRYHEAIRFATLLVDSVNELNLYELATNGTSTAAKSGKASPNAVPAGAKTAATATTKPTNAAAAAAAAARFMDPSIISTGAPFRPVMNNTPSAVKAPEAMPAAAPVPSSSALPAPPAAGGATSAAAINANPMAAMAAYQSARVALQNATLPQSLDGIVASAVYQSDESVRRDVERLQNVLKNISQILQLTPDQLLRDHQQLVSLALEAQMTELQQSAAATTTTPATATAAAAAAPVTEVSRRHSEAFNSYVLAKLLPPVAKEIAQGVARGLRDTLRVELDSAVNAAFGANVHASQKAVLRRRLDEALQSSVRELGADVAKRVDTYIEKELSESLARVNASMSALEEQNRKLQTALQQIVSSGAVQEVEAMRAELAQLRAAIQSGASVLGDGANAAAPSAPSPQTVIETAEKYIKEGQVAQGIAYVTMAQNPRCVVQLLARLSEDEVATVVSDAETPETTWSKIVAQLCEADAAESASEVELVASFLFDVLSEHEEVISKKTAKAQQIRSDVRHLVARARGKIDSSEGRRVLKDLEKSIQ